jgi:hypothetical protein
MSGTETEPEPTGELPVASSARRDPRGSQTTPTLARDQPTLGGRPGGTHYFIQRSKQMSFSTSIPRTVTLGRSHPLVVIVTVAAFIVASTWAITSSGTDPARQPPRPSAHSQALVLRSLATQQRQYVTGIASLSLAQLSAAFGTLRYHVDPALTSLTPKQRRYVRAITSMSYAQLAAAFGGSQATTGDVR